MAALGNISVNISSVNNESLKLTIPTAPDISIAIPASSGGSSGSSGTPGSVTFS